MHGILRSAGCQNFAEAQERLKQEMRTANNEMVTVLQSLIASMWQKNIDNEFTATVVAKIHDAPNLFEFSLPYFFGVPDGPLPDA